MNSIKTLLIIEDNPGDARLIREMLDEHETLQAELFHVGSMNDAEKHLTNKPVDFILLDLGLPDAQGLDAIKRIRAVAPDIPLVVLTGMDDDQLAAQSLREGAQDYLIKGQIESRGLLRTLRYANERKRLDRMKEEFVSTVSHELRTPLTSITGSLGLLASGSGGILPAQAERLLTIAHTNCIRLVRLVNDILDTEKLESGRLAFRLSRVDARSVVDKVVEADRGFAEGLGVHVDVSGVPCGVAYVHADADRLMQAVSNLLSNAVKFSTKVVVSVEREAELVRISIGDNGPGVPADFRSRIFTRFAQADGSTVRRKGGTGLGLYIVKQIVDRLGGKVSFGEGENDGTIFRIELPAWEGDAVALQPRENEDAASTDPKATLEQLAREARDRLTLELGNGGSAARPGSRDSYRT
jgi:signal transduction histidine kinase